MTWCHWPSPESSAIAVGSSTCSSRLFILPSVIEAFPWQVGPAGRELYGWSYNIWIITSSLQPAPLKSNQSAYLFVLLSWAPNLHSSYIIYRLAPHPCIYDRMGIYMSESAAPPSSGINCLSSFFLASVPLHSYTQFTLVYPSYFFETYTYPPLLSILVCDFLINFVRRNSNKKPLRPPSSSRLQSSSSLVTNVRPSSSETFTDFVDKQRTESSRLFRSIACFQ